LIMEAGEGILDWKGIRVYLRMRGYETSGELIETIRSQSSNSQTNSANPGGFPDTLATFAAIFLRSSFAALSSSALWTFQMSMTAYFCAIQIWSGKGADR